MKMCVCLKEHMRVDFVFSSLCMVCPGSAVSYGVATFPLALR